VTTSFRIQRDASDRQEPERKELPMNHPDYLFTIARDRQRELIAQAEASRRRRRAKRKT
jgi:hypothetical protein